MTNMPTPTLVDFLLARIAEDEADVRTIKPVEWIFAVGGRLDTHNDHDRFGPARVLAECEAKRRIVERAAVTTHLDYDARWAQQEALRDLATVYADHPDYNPDWRP